MSVTDYGFTPLAIGTTVTYTFCDRLFSITGVLISEDKIFYTIVSTLDSGGGYLVFQHVHSVFITEFEDI